VEASDRRANVLQTPMAIYIEFSILQGMHRWTSTDGRSWNEKLQQRTKEHKDKVKFVCAYLSNSSIAIGTRSFLSSQNRSLFDNSMSSPRAMHSCKQLLIPGSMRS
jgi:hypothetical protein